MFQSHNGAIAAVKDMIIVGQARWVSIPQWCDCCQACCTVLWGWLLVSIPQWCDCCPKFRAWRFHHQSFNPTMVRLLLGQIVDQLWSNRGFNPTMVRLLLKSQPRDRHFADMFQSHNGAIAAFTSPYFPLPLISGFNPTMVRLLPRQNFGFWGQNEAK